MRYKRVSWPLMAETQIAEQCQLVTNIAYLPRLPEYDVKSKEK